MSADDVTSIGPLNRRSGSFGGADLTGEMAAVALLAVALALWWLWKWHPSLLPFWAPYEFSWPEFLAIWLTIGWYVRGLALTAAVERPPAWRQLSFLCGMLVIYAMVQTRFDYLAQHMFFLNRLQHLGMHHLGPFLVALSWPGATIKLGMPSPLRRLVAHPVVAATVNVLQRPMVAAVLFAGLVALWLIPPVHFHAMINTDLYAFMNWSMVVDGVLFWCLVLDPRPKPPARTSFGTRLALVLAVMFPQSVIGASIAFADGDLYPSYDLCGRLYPAIDAHTDQMLGALIGGIPAATINVLALLLVVKSLARWEETKKEGDFGRNIPDAIEVSLCAES